jgi:ribosomal protein L11
MFKIERLESKKKKKKKKEILGAIKLKDLTRIAKIR